MGGLTLQGCASMKDWHQSDHLLTRGWAQSPASPPAMAPTGSTPTAETLYCYKSLAQIDCYKTAQPGKEHLRVGQEFSPPPAPQDETTPESGSEPESIHPSSDPIDIHSLPLSLQKESSHAPTPPS
jgi:hypothetical protein